MVSKAEVKFVRLLHQKKYRGENRLFIAEGSKIAFDILKSRLKVHKIYATAAWLSENMQNIPDKEGREIAEVSLEEMSKMSSLDSAQEVLLLVHIPEYGDTAPDQDAKIILAADSIRDPGNLGTMVRICDWYGIEQLYCSEDCAEIYNPKTVRATMGSIGRVEVIYTDLKLLIQNLVGRQCYAATLDGNINIHTAVIKGPVLLVMGNESHGVSEQIIRICDDTMMIPRFGMAESLNASIASAVLVDNLVRINEL